MEIKITNDDGDGAQCLRHK